eukprot:3560813-Rhodomonas_salina.3
MPVGWGRITMTWRAAVAGPAVGSAAVHSGSCNVRPAVRPSEAHAWSSCSPARVEGQGLRTNGQGSRVKGQGSRVKG